MIGECEIDRGGNSGVENRWEKKMKEGRMIQVKGTGRYRSRLPVQQSA